MAPPFRIISGFTPKNAGFHKTRSANFPTSTEPTKCEMPCVIAGLMEYLAMYRLMRVLSAYSKDAGFHKTRSANFPTSTEPTKCEMPCVIAGLMEYLAMYRLMRVLSEYS